LALVSPTAGAGAYPFFVAGDCALPLCVEVVVVGVGVVCCVGVGGFLGLLRFFGLLFYILMF
jgi:hypothetical protein